MQTQFQTEVMTLREVAAYLRVHKSTLYQMIKRGELPAFKIGSDWRCNRRDLERWCLSQTGFQPAKSLENQ